MKYYTYTLTFDEVLEFQDNTTRSALMHRLRLRFSNSEDLVEIRHPEGFVIEMVS